MSVCTLRPVSRLTPSYPLLDVEAAGPQCPPPTRCQCLQSSACMEAMTEPPSGAAQRAPRGALAAAVLHLCLQFLHTN